MPSPDCCPGTSLPPTRSVGHSWPHCQSRPPSLRNRSLTVEVVIRSHTLLVDRQIRHGSPEPRVLLFEILDPLDLVGLQSAEFFAPAVVGQFAHANLADSISNRATLRCQNINLAKLGNNLFRLVSLTHFSVLLRAILILRVGPLLWGRATSTVDHHWLSGSSANRQAYRSVSCYRNIILIWSGQSFQLNKVHHESSRAAWHFFRN